MTVGELSRRMTTQEFAEWLAYTRYFQAIPDSWAETGLLTSAIMAPYCERGKAPRAADFNPVETPPQHQTQAREVILDLRKQLGLD
jgi:hypothetical protein